MHLRNYLNAEIQQELIETCRTLYLESPMWTPSTKSGAKYSYQNTSCGEVGWISDKLGYYYSPTHPISGKPFPEIPELIKSIAAQAAAIVGETINPQTCLINYYSRTGKLGLHQDNSEPNKTKPIISISLGDDAVFLLGGKNYRDKSQEYILKSGDVFLLSGENRMAYHGIKQIIPNTSNLLKNGGRLNLTIRQVY